jgi:leucyl aminopeptidase
MTGKIDISFSKSHRVTGGVAILLKTVEAELPAGVADADPAGIFGNAAGRKFTGKSMSVLDVVAPHGSEADRMVVVGLGKAAALTAHDWLKAGGKAAASLKGADKATVFLDVPGLEISPKAAADFALGMLLRAYKFDTYKTKKKNDSNGDDEANANDKDVKVTIVTADASAAKKAFADAEAVAEGVVLARNLVNEPANVLGPEEFADTAKKLEALGVDIGDSGKGNEELGMGALLGVAQGSGRRPAESSCSGRAASQNKPIAFVGKGVVFDTGGISTAGRRYGGDEGRHGRGGCRDRPDAHARCAQGQGQCRRHHRPRREYARRQCPAAGRHRHLDVRPDHRGHQYRCRRPPRARRRALVLQ